MPPRANLHSDEGLVCHRERLQPSAPRTGAVPPRAGGERISERRRGATIVELKGQQRLERGVEAVVELEQRTGDRKPALKAGDERAKREQFGAQTRSVGAVRQTKDRCADAADATTTTRQRFDSTTVGRTHLPR